jgi:hypothetical protein
VSAVIGAIGVRSVVGLTGITLASNLGTFTLYGLACASTTVACRKRQDHNVLLHDIVPALGVRAKAVFVIPRREKFNGFTEHLLPEPRKPGDPMGEGKNHGLRVDFDSRLRLEFHGATITSGGLLAYRQFDDALGLTEIAESCLHDVRHGKKTQHSLGAQLRQSVFSRLAGCEDTNDAERLSVDPAMRHVVGGLAIDRSAASTSQVGRFEAETLTLPENLTELMNLSGKWIDRLRKRSTMKKVILDMASSVSETYGRQEGAACNGYFGCTCYHPLFCFNNFGDLEDCLLREGNVHSAKDWKAVLEPIVARYRDLDTGRHFRGDAAFGNPNVYSYLEVERYGYAIRLRSNDILNREIEQFMTRPVGRPPRAPIVHYHEFMYKATAWDRQRRVVAKVEWHRGELFPRVGFIVTNLRWRTKNVVRFYNHRGTAEQMIKEGKNAVKWTRLSGHDFVDN